MKKNYIQTYMNHSFTPGVHRLNDITFIIFNINNISAPINRFKLLYDHLDSLPSLLPLLIKSIDITSSTILSKNFDIVIHIPIIESFYSLHASSSLHIIDYHLFTINGTASGHDIHLHAFASFSSNDSSSTNCIARFDVSSISPLPLSILKIVFNFIHPIAPSIMAFAANNF